MSQIRAAVQSGAVTTGLSFTTNSIGREREREIAYGGNARMLLYFGPELTFSFINNPDLEFVYRLHHRSGDPDVSRAGVEARRDLPAAERRLAGEDQPLPLPVRLLPELRTMTRVDPPDGGLKETSWALCEAVRSISTDRLVDGPWGTLATKTLAAIEYRVRALLDL